MDAAVYPTNGTELINWSPHSEQDAKILCAKVGGRLTYNCTVLTGIIANEISINHVMKGMNNLLLLL
jgi:hypothetical protein